MFCKIYKIIGRLSHKDLKNTIFESCDLSHSDWSFANIEGTRFDNCKINNTILDDNGCIQLSISKGFKLS